jgi:indole-3-glycerol phosphate synthase/phosphoribosylanthranilate isomerase
MEVVTEVHDEVEAARAIALGATIIGINNRSLRTLDVDLATTPRLARHIPHDRLIVAESGITDRETILALRGDADAFLIGSALMRRPDIDRTVRGLVYGRTKICGLTTSSDAVTALEAGATHGGLIFAAASPRSVPEEAAARIASAAPLEWVGVFADQEPDEIAAVAARLQLAAVQLHGNERAHDIAQVRARVPAGTAVWKAERIRRRLPYHSSADRVVLDGWKPGKLGGTGVSFDRPLLDNYGSRESVILAGGLRPENVATAAAKRTWAP